MFTGFDPRPIYLHMQIGMASTFYIYTTMWLFLRIGRFRWFERCTTTARPVRAVVGTSPGPDNRATVFLAFLDVCTGTVWIGAVAYVRHVPFRV